MVSCIGSAVRKTFCNINYEVQEAQTLASCIQTILAFKSGSRLVAHAAPPPPPRPRKEKNSWPVPQLGKGCHI